MLNKYKLLENEITQLIHTEKLNGDNLALALNNRGHAKYMQVDFDGAVDDYNEALLINSNLAIALYNRGTVRYRLGMYHDAITDLSKAVTIDNTNKEFLEAFTDCSNKINSVKTST